MAGTIKTDIVQLGDSPTATQNLVIRTNANGTFTVARGNAGATTQDILTIDANGKVLLPQSKGPAFRAYQTVGQSIPNSDTVLSLDTKDFDTALAFSTATNRFQPLVAGYYQLSGSAQSAIATGSWYTVIYKNGGPIQYGTYIPVSSSSPISVCSALIFFNGTTDYVELRAASGTTGNTTPGNGRVTFSGFLAREA